MTISEGDKRLLFQRSGNRCAFPECPKSLTFEDENIPVTSISEIAHIVSREIDGPRGTHPLEITLRDAYENLILLCEEHHHIVDTHPASFPVEMLRRWKTEHETRISRATGQVPPSGKGGLSKESLITERLHSNLLAVTTMPEFIYSANIVPSTEGIHLGLWPNKFLIAYIVRGVKLFTFTNLDHFKQPFAESIEKKTVTREESTLWWPEPEKRNLFVTLLNRSLSKFTGRKNLDFDQRHNRYFFQPHSAGEVLEVQYQPLNQAKAPRKVVWQPVTKKTGLAKNYWLHKAVSLRFILTNKHDWCLSIRPELHITSDGRLAYPSEYRGRKITKRLSRSYNYDFLGDLQFWRSYLSDGLPRILIPFGGSQYVEVQNRFIETNVAWPGMPEEHARPFRNIYPLETLDSLLEFSDLTSPLIDDKDEDTDWGDFTDE